MLTANGYDDYEVFYPYIRLKEEEIGIDIASEKKETLKGNFFIIKADMCYEDVKAEEYAGLLLPGGSAPEIVRLHTKAIEIVKEFMDRQMPVAAICHGQQLLISAGALKDRKCTCYKSIADDLINAGAVYLDEPVVEDGNLITSRCPDDLHVFVKTFINKLV